MAFNNYLEDENDKPYFTTNSLAYYYDKMEGFAKAVEGSAKELNLTKEEIEQRIALRLAEWDKNLESFDGSVEKLLTEWVDDGTLTHVIDSTLIDQKVTPLALQLAEKVGGDRKATFADLSQEVKEGMTGGGVAVVGKNAVLTENIVDKQVTIDKISFSKMSTNIFNEATATKGVVIGTDGNITASESYNVTEFIKVTPGEIIFPYGMVSIARYNADKGFESRSYINETGEALTMWSTTHWVRFNYQPAKPYPERRVNRGGSLLAYEPYYIKLDGVGVGNSTVGKSQIINEAVTSEKIANNGATFSKRTKLGGWAILQLSTSNAKLPKISIANKTLTISAPSYLYYGNTRHVISNEVVINLAQGSGQAMQHVVFNTTTSQFKVINGAFLSEYTEHDLLIASINWTSNSQTEIKSVFATFNYETDQQQSVGDLDTPYVFYPEEITGWYKPSDAMAYNDFSAEPSVTTVFDFYSKFTELASVHSGYVTETNYGNDSSGAYPVYRYDLKEPTTPVYPLGKQRPTLAIVCGVHGSEKDSMFSVYYLLKDICENWRSNPLLEYLRFNVDISIIPCANPWGYMNMNRVNANGVDVNRNFPYNHTPGTFGQNTYGGETPFSEVEAVYLKNFIDSLKHAVYLGDYHTNNGSGDVYDNLMWLPLNTVPFNDNNLNVAGKYLVEKVTREFIKSYEQPSDVGFFGYVSNTSNGGTLKTYGAQQGIPSSTFECFRKFPNETEYHTPKTIKACTEFFGNWLLTVLKQFKSVA